MYTKCNIIYKFIKIAFRGINVMQKSKERPILDNVVESINLDSR